MSEYKVVTQDTGSIMSRNVVQAAIDLADQVQQLQRDGWTPLGGVASIEAGTSIYLLQAMVRGT